MKTDGFLSVTMPSNVFINRAIIYSVSSSVSHQVIFEKKINFSEYKGYIFPLSYLLDQSIIDKSKKSSSFEERINVLSKYFLSALHKHESSSPAVSIVSNILSIIVFSVMISPFHWKNWLRKTRSPFAHCNVTLKPAQALEAKKHCR